MRVARGAAEERGRLRGAHKLAAAVVRLIFLRGYLFSAKVPYAVAKGTTLEAFVALLAASRRRVRERRAQAFDLRRRRRFHAFLRSHELYPRLGAPRERVAVDLRGFSRAPCSRRSSTG